MIEVSRNDRDGKGKKLFAKFEWQMQENYWENLLRTSGNH